MFKNNNKLIPFQEVGSDWLITGHPAKFLCDDCGLGKTVQVVAAAIKAVLPSMLVVCLGTPGVKESWIRTAIDWGYCEPEDVQIIRTRADKVDLTKKLVAISFELLLEKRIVRELKGKLWGVVVVDEEHVCKTLTSQRSKIVLGKDALVGYGYFKWLLSATPMPNYPVELFPALWTLRPELIDSISYETYLIRYCGAFPEFNGYGVDYKTGNATNVDDLKKRIAPFILRREIQDVYPVIPPVIRKTVYIDIGDLDATVHDTPLGTLQRITGEAKVAQIAQYVLNWVCENPDENLIVFAYHQNVIQELCELLRVFAHTNVIKGSTTRANKELIKEWFTTGSKGKILLLQITSGGTAIDGLQQVCNHIIFAEPNWTPGVKNQGIGRLRRHGQTKSTYVTEIIAQKTIDETKIGSCYNKQLTIDVLLDNKTHKTEDKNPMDEQLIGLAERLVSVIEYLAYKDGDEPATGNDSKQTKTRTRRTKEQIEADKLAAQTGAVQTPPVTSVLSVVPNDAPAPQIQQPAFQPQQPTNGQTVTWDDVMSVCSSSLNRIKTQMQPDNPAAALGAAQALLAIVYKQVGGPGTGSLNELQTRPETWSSLIAGFNATNHVAPALTTNF